MVYTLKTILLIDDSPLIIARVQHILEGIHTISNILTAENFAQAKPLLQKKPDIVLLDIQLPDTNGIDILRFIKREYPDIIVIMLTNDSSETYRARCTALGSYAFLDKSTEFHLIPSTIAPLL